MTPGGGPRPPWGIDDPQTAKAVLAGAGSPAAEAIPEANAGDGLEQYSAPQEPDHPSLRSLWIFLAIIAVVALLLGLVLFAFPR